MHPPILKRHFRTFFVDVLSASLTTHGSIGDVHHSLKNNPSTILSTERKVVPSDAREVWYTGKRLRLKRSTIKTATTIERRARNFPIRG